MRFIIDCDNYFQEMNYMGNFWNRIWEGKSYKDFSKYIDLNVEHEFLKYFPKYNVKRVCDIACGFGNLVLQQVLTIMKFMENIIYKNN